LCDPDKFFGGGISKAITPLTTGTTLIVSIDGYDEHLRINTKTKLFLRRSSHISK